MARVAFATSSAVAWMSSAVTWTRGVITFSAFSSARLEGADEQLGGVRLQGALLGGVAGEGDQFLGLRAEASSSAGSRPKRRTRWLAEVLR
ncbi:hypothetical protein STENM36S_08488 [Streptomyces tendae]